MRNRANSGAWDAASGSGAGSGSGPGSDAEEDDAEDLEKAKKKHQNRMNRLCRKKPSADARAGHIRRTTSNTGCNSKGLSPKSLERVRADLSALLPADGASSGRTTRIRSVRRTITNGSIGGQDGPPQPPDAPARATQH